jgi:hypothetical protein
MHLGFDAVCKAELSTRWLTTATAREVVQWWREHGARQDPGGTRAVSRVIH